MNKPILKKLGVLSAVAFAAGCSDDEDPTMFAVEIENISPVYDFNASGVYNTPLGEDGPGPLMPGQAYEVSFAAGPGSKLSFASMFGNSNDFFYAPAEGGIPLFDGDGNAISGDVTDQVYLWDAGTELNQEPGDGPDQAPLQAAPDTGAVDPNPNVRMAPDDFDNLPMVDEVIAVSLMPSAGNMFTLHIENVSTSTTLQYSGGSSAVVLSPGVWVVHTADSPLFSSGRPDYGEGLERIAEDGNPMMEGEAVATRTGLTSPVAPGIYAVHGAVQPLFSDGMAARGMGLEALAEDGDPSALASNLMDDSSVIEDGVFNTPIGEAEPGPLFPGSSFRVELSASPGERLSLATMLGQSNDLFYAFGPEGIALFDANGQPISGDVSSALALWDAGTEVNEYPGAGPNQAPRQSAPGAGPAEGGVVHLVDDGYTYPEPTDILRVTITPM